MDLIRMNLHYHKLSATTDDRIVAIGGSDALRGLGGGRAPLGPPARGVERRRLQWDPPPDSELRLARLVRLRLVRRPSEGSAAVSRSSDRIELLLLPSLDRTRHTAEPSDDESSFFDSFKRTLRNSARAAPSLFFLRCWSSLAA